MLPHDRDQRGVEGIWRRVGTVRRRANPEFGVVDPADGEIELIVVPRLGAKAIGEPVVPDELSPTLKSPVHRGEVHEPEPCGRQKMSKRAVGGAGAAGIRLLNVARMGVRIDHG